MITQIVFILLGCLYSISTLANEPFTKRTLTGKVSIVLEDGQVVKDASNVVIFLDNMPDSFRSSNHQQKPVSSQRGKRFSPAVLPIVVGQSVEFLNDDDIFHNVFSLSKAKLFDLGIYQKGTSKTVLFDKTGLIKIYCNLHPDMVSHILVLNNPYFTVTDAAGSFTLDSPDVPDATLNTWYQFSDSQTMELSSIDNIEGALNNIDITITKKFKQHKNKFGKHYKSKY